MRTVGRILLVLTAVAVGVVLTVLAVNAAALAEFVVLLRGIGQAAEVK